MSDDKKVTDIATKRKKKEVSGKNPAKVTVDEVAEKNQELPGTMATIQIGAYPTQDGSDIGGIGALATVGNVQVAPMDVTQQCIMAAIQFLDFERTIRMRIEPVNGEPAFDAALTASRYGIPINSVPGKVMAIGSDIIGEDILLDRLKTVFPDITPEQVQAMWAEVFGHCEQLFFRLLEGDTEKPESV